MFENNAWLAGGVAPREGVFRSIVHPSLGAHRGPTGPSAPSSSSSCARTLRTPPAPAAVVQEEDRQARPSVRRSARASAFSATATRRSSRSRWARRASSRLRSARTRRPRPRCDRRAVRHARVSPRCDRVAQRLCGHRAAMKQRGRYVEPRRRARVAVNGPSQLHPRPRQYVAERDEAVTTYARFEEIPPDVVHAVAAAYVRVFGDSRWSHGLTPADVARKLARDLAAADRVAHRPGRIGARQRRRLLLGRGDSDRRRPGPDRRRLEPVARRRAAASGGGSRERVQRRPDRLRRRDRVASPRARAATVGRGGHPALGADARDRETGAARDPRLDPPARRCRSVS